LSWLREVLDGEAKNLDLAGGCCPLRVNILPIHLGYDEKLPFGDAIA
jgi:hypothetical protein